MDSVTEACVNEKLVKAKDAVGCPVLNECVFSTSSYVVLGD